MKKIITTVIVFLLVSNISYSSVFASQAQISLEVVDDNGKSVKGARVGVSFERNTSQGTQVTTKRGRTDLEGYFSALGSGNGFISIGAHKEGFYDSYYDHTFLVESGGRWQPWDQTIEVLLRKIENPVPMYARNTKHSIIEIPVLGEDVGFDLTKFDWVIPYGTGTHGDFIFHLKRRVVNRKDFDATLTVTFSNEYDGIQSYREDLSDGSQFKLPRYAPENGYQDKLILKEWRHPGDYNVKRNFDFMADDMNYIFRVRSEEEDGQLARAMYGKILGYIDFTAVHSKRAKIYFKYYLNSDYTRNLEYDPEQNLFGDLPPLEEVGIK